MNMNKWGKNIQSNMVLPRNKVVTKPQARRNCDVISFQSDTGTDQPTNGPTNEPTDQHSEL
jgi:hypothetical protein